MLINHVRLRVSCLLSIAMSHDIHSIFLDEDLVKNAYPLSDLCILQVKNKTSIDKLNELMDMGWTIMSTWIESDVLYVKSETDIFDISMRLGKETTRLILVTDVPTAMALDVIPNMDADNPGDNPDIITGMKSPLSRLRAASISGYGPYASKGPGLKEPATIPKLSIIGLDFEVTTIFRGDGMPLSHDPIISIVTSNGGWYDKEFEDKCYCIFAFGECRNIDWDCDRSAVIIKVDGNEQAVKTTYDVLNSLSPDFVNIYNGFNFDLRCLAASATLDPVVGPTFEERRLGNTGVGIF